MARIKPDDRRPVANGAQAQAPAPTDTAELLIDPLTSSVPPATVVAPP